MKLLRLADSRLTQVKQITHVISREGLRLTQVTHVRSREHPNGNIASLR